MRAPIDTWSAIAPVAILAGAAGHAVQVLKRYYEEYAARGDNRQAVIASIEKVGPIMVTAGVIAAAGFASLATFQVSSVRVFGRTCRTAPRGCAASVRLHQFSVPTLHWPPPLGIRAETLTVV